jgi:hypothetical protein
VGVSLIVECVAMPARDLKPGDLFSIRGPEYWLPALHSGSVGEKVYVRTDTPATGREDDTPVYRLTFSDSEDS